MDVQSQSGPVLIAYPDGRSYVVSDAVSAASAHPDAQIVRYESGEEFVPAQDASVIAQREAEEKRAARQRPKAPDKPDTAAKDAG